MDQHDLKRADDQRRREAKNERARERRRLASKVERDTPITVLITFTRERLCSLLTGALEGGSNYWMRTNRERSKRPSQPLVSLDWLDFLQSFPWGDGYIGIDDVEDGKQFTLDESRIRAGLRIMADKYPNHFADFIGENDDATTADVFLQCCLFGEVVYG